MNKLKILKYTLNALIMFVIPATATAISQIPDSMFAADTKISLGVLVGWFLAVLKAAEFVVQNQSEKENERG